MYSSNPRLAGGRSASESGGSERGKSSIGNNDRRRVEDGERKGGEELTNNSFGTMHDDPTGLQLSTSGADMSSGDIDGSMGSLDMEQRVEQLFPLYSHGEDEMSFVGLHAMLEEIGLNIEESELRGQVGDEQIDLDLAIDVATQLHAADLGHGIQNIGISESGSQRVTPWQFIKMKLTCRTRRGVRYQILWPKLEVELSPRKILLGGTLLMLLITSLAVIGTVAALWVATETNREKRILNTLGATVESFAELFETNWVETAGREAESETDVFTSFLGRAHVSYVAQGLSSIRQRTECVLSVMDHSFNYSDTVPQVERTRGRLTQLRSLYRSTVNAAAVYNSTTQFSTNATSREESIAALVQSWTAEEAAIMPESERTWDFALFKTATTELLTTSRFDTTVVEVSSVLCLQQIISSINSYSSSGDKTAAEKRDSSQLIDLSPSLDLQGKTALVKAVTFPEWGLGVCAFYRSDVSQAHAQEEAIAQIAPIATTLSVTLNTGFALSTLIDGLAEGTTTTVTDATNTSTSTSSVHHWLSAPAGSGDSACYQEGSCNEIDTMTTNALLSTATNASVIPSWNASSEDALCAVVVSRTQNIALGLCLGEYTLLNTSRVESVSIIDYLNFNFVRSTEIVASTEDESGILQAQISAYRFFDGCYGVCERSVPSSLNAIAAFANQGSGFSITPDYRPEPVMGGYKYSSDLDLAVLIERDVLEIRGRASDVLILILDDYNRVADGAEIIGTRPPHYPPMKTFDPSDSCPTGVTCIESLGHGIVYRSDCIHCQRLLVPEITTLSFLTSLLSLPPGCNRSVECSDEVLSQYQLYRRPFDESHADGELATVTALGYAGPEVGEVLAGYSFLANLSLGIVTQWPQSNFQTPIFERIGVSVGVALLFVIFAIFTLMFQSRKNLDDIELDWKKYKEQISEENERFSETVLEVLPSRVAERMMKGGLLFAESKAVTVMMVNCVGFQVKVAALPTSMLAVYSSYTFLLISNVCRHFRVHKVRTVGDIVVAAGGVSADDNEVEGQHRVAMRTTHAACVIIQLFSYLFDHSMSDVEALGHMKTGGVLERLSSVAAAERVGGWGGSKGGGVVDNSSVSPPGGESAVGSGATIVLGSDGLSSAHQQLDQDTRRASPAPKTRGLGGGGIGGSKGGGGSMGAATTQQELIRALEMPNVKIGINQGTCTLCVLSCFSTPNFDVIGPTVSIAQRLMMGAKRNTINVSQSVTDSLEKMKANGELKTSGERRQTLKNQLIRSHLIVGANIPVPPQVLQSLGIRRSHPRMYFGEGGAGPKFGESSSSAPDQRTTVSSDDRRGSGGKRGAFGDARSQA